jgi:2-hydroxycyclohexanecarboxyl-CoA dehydrogenase
MNDRPRNIVITGGSSGIGLAAAMRFAAEGAKIVINGRNGERGARACEAIKGRHPSATVWFAQADVSLAEEASRLVDEAAGHFGGPIDVLVTSAGGDFSPALFHETSLEHIEAITRHWLLSTLFCCRCALPKMTEGAAIVNVASDAAKVPTPGEAVIGAAMSGIVMFTRTLAMEAKRRRVRVNAVTPSLVLNTMTHRRVTAGGFSARLFEKAAKAAHLGLPEPDDAAALIQFLASAQAEKITGQAVSVNGGISAG